MYIHIYLHVYIYIYTYIFIFIYIYASSAWDLKLHTPFTRPCCCNNATIACDIQSCKPSSTSSPVSICTFVLV